MANDNKDRSLLDAAVDAFVPEGVQKAVGATGDYLAEVPAASRQLAGEVASAVTNTVSGAVGATGDYLAEVPAASRQLAGEVASAVTNTVSGAVGATGDYLAEVPAASRQLAGEVADAVGENARNAAFTTLDGIKAARESGVLLSPLNPLGVLPLVGTLTDKILGKEPEDSPPIKLIETDEKNMNMILMRFNGLSEPTTVKDFGVTEETKPAKTTFDKNDKVTTIPERKEYTISFEHEVAGNKAKVEVQYNPETKKYSVSPEMKDMGVSVGKSNDGDLLIKIDNNQFKDSAARSNGQAYMHAVSHTPSELIITKSEINEKIDLATAQTTEAKANSDPEKVVATDKDKPAGDKTSSDKGGLLQKIKDKIQGWLKNDPENAAAAAASVASSVNVVINNAHTNNNNNQVGDSASASPTNTQINVTGATPSAAGTATGSAQPGTGTGQPAAQPASGTAGAAQQGAATGQSAGTTEQALNNHFRQEFRDNSQGHATIQNNGGFGNRDGGTMVALAQIQINKLIEQDKLEGVKPLEVNAKLDGITKKALEAFQKSQGFAKSDQDGILGEQTWSALREATMESRRAKPLDELKAELHNKYPDAERQANAYDAARGQIPGKVKLSPHNDGHDIQAPVGGPGQKRETGSPTPP